MKLVREIAEAQERGRVAYMDDLCACFDRGAAEKIIAAKLEPVREAHRQVVNCTARVRNEGCRFCSDASKCLDDLMEALAMFEEE